MSSHAKLMTKSSFVLSIISVALLCHKSILTVNSFASPTTPVTRQRTFRYIPYGSSMEQDDDDVNSGTITCDGRVPGATLDLTHWNGNETPDTLYSDTSTGMALRLAAFQKQQQQEGSATDNHDNSPSKQALQPYLDARTVVNNHYDTDGVLSVWTCLEPSLALEYRTLLDDGAAAGDFGEWPSDASLMLDAIVSGYCDPSDEAASYERILADLPLILKDLSSPPSDETATLGSNYPSHWEDVMRIANEGRKQLQSGQVTLARSKTQPNIVIVYESNYSSKLSSPALHRGLREQDLWKGTDRILRVTAFDQNEDDDGNGRTGCDMYSYVYEKIGHGWVNKLVSRHMVPPVDGAQLVQHLNADKRDMYSASWTKGGPSGLVGICYSAKTTTNPEDTARHLAEHDEGCQ